MLVRELIDSWIAYSHRMQLKHLFGVDARGASPHTLEDLVGVYNAYRRGEAIANRLRDAGFPVEGPIAEAGTNDMARLSCSYPGSCQPALYSYTAGGEKRWRGLDANGVITEPLRLPKHPRYEISVSGTIRSWLLALLRGHAVPYGDVADLAVDQAIDRLVARNETCTAFLAAGGDAAARAQELASTCRKCGCQRRGAAKLLAAYGFPDPTPYLDGVARSECRPWTVMKLRRGIPGAPAGAPVMLVARTPDGSGHWRVSDDALRILGYKVADKAESFAHCPADEARAFYRRLADNLTALFSGDSEEGAAPKTSSPAAA